MEKVAREYAEWLEKPRQIDADIADKVSIDNLPYLSPRVRSNLQDSGINEFYPVQHGLIPFIIDTAGQTDAVDVCCSAPTGSGKTLAYAIPLVEILSRAVCERKVAALVVLPVKELAEQVAAVIRRVARETSVHCALLSGEKSFEDECAELSGAEWRSVAERDFINFLQRSNPASVDGNVSEHRAERALQRCSRQTIVVCTPSRLLLHIHRNTTFCKALRSLVYLVIDEADRVLHDAVRSGWLSALEHAVGIERYARTALPPRLASVPLDSISTTSFNPIRKLLLSATFTRNPELLHAMRMHKPVLFAARPVVKVKQKAGEKVEAKTAVAETEPVAMETTTEAADAAPCRYVAPSGLQEYFVACAPEYKPLALYMLLRTKMGKLCADGDAQHGGEKAKEAPVDGNGKPRRRASVLCFVNSRESSQRLAHVLAQLGGSQLIVSELSARLPSAKRRRIISQLGRSEIDIVVCTDAMARGMDIGNVRCVVSYDMPAHAKTYVHRCGRTARAGQRGTAISILHRSQVRAFKSMLQQISGGGFGTSLHEEKLPEQRLRPFRKAYQESLRSLRTSVRTKRPREKASKEHSANATATENVKTSTQKVVDVNQK